MKDIQLYKPIGPLKYLVMDKNAVGIVGLYNELDTENIVLIFKTPIKLVVVKPSEMELKLLLQEKKTILETVKKSNIFNTNKKTISLFCRAIFYVWVLTIMPGKLSKIKRHSLLPNFYYTYTQFQFNNQSVRG